MLMADMAASGAHRTSSVTAWFRSIPAGIVADVLVLLFFYYLRESVVSPAINTDDNERWLAFVIMTPLGHVIAMSIGLLVAWPSLKRRVAAHGRNIWPVLAFVAVQVIARLVGGAMTYLDCAGQCGSYVLRVEYQTMADLATFPLVIIVAVIAYGRLTGRHHHKSSGHHASADSSDKP